MAFKKGMGIVLIISGFVLVIIGAACLKNDKDAKKTSFSSLNEEVSEDIKPYLMTSNQKFFFDINTKDFKRN